MHVQANSPWIYECMHTHTSNYKANQLSRKEEGYDAFMLDTGTHRVHLLKCQIFQHVYLCVRNLYTYMEYNLLGVSACYK
jgi:hypothetical protein